MASLPSPLKRWSPSFCFIRRLLYLYRALSCSMSLEITFPRTACSTSLTVGSQGVSRHSRRLGTQSARCDGAHSLPTLPPPLCLALSCGAVNPHRTGRTELASVTYLYRDRFASGCNIPTSPTFCKTLRSGGRKWKRYSVLAQRQKNTSVFAMRFSLSHACCLAHLHCFSPPLPVSLQAQPQRCF